MWCVCVCVCVFRVWGIYILALHGRHRSMRLWTLATRRRCGPTVSKGSWEGWRVTLGRAALRNLGYMPE